MTRVNGKEATPLSGAIDDLKTNYQVACKDVARHTLKGRFIIALNNLFIKLRLGPAITIKGAPDLVVKTAQAALLIAQKSFNDPSHKAFTKEEKEGLENLFKVFKSHLSDKKYAAKVKECEQIKNEILGLPGKQQRTKPAEDKTKVERPKVETPPDETDGAKGKTEPTDETETPDEAKAPDETPPSPPGPTPPPPPGSPPPSKPPIKQPPKQPSNGADDKTGSSFLDEMQAKQKDFKPKTSEEIDAEREAKLAKNDLLKQIHQGVKLKPKMTPEELKKDEEDRIQHLKNKGKDEEGLTEQEKITRALKKKAKELHKGTIVTDTGAANPERDWENLERTRIDDALKNSKLLPVNKALILAQEEKLNLIVGKTLPDGTIEKLPKDQIKDLKAQLRELKKDDFKTSVGKKLAPGASEEDIKKALAAAQPDQFKNAIDEALKDLVK